MGLRKARGFMVYRDSAVLVGRAAEQAMIAGLLARSAHGSALLIRGAPGIGKSALVDDAVVRASRSRKVLRAAGTPLEPGWSWPEFINCSGRSGRGRTQSQNFAARH